MKKERKWPISLKLQILHMKIGYNINNNRDKANDLIQNLK